MYYGPLEPADPDCWFISNGLFFYCCLLSANQPMTKVSANTDIGIDIWIQLGETEINVLMRTDSMRVQLFKTSFNDEAIDSRSQASQKHF